MNVRTIVARYAGKCGDCGNPIAVGDVILYGGRGKVAHVGCDLGNVEAGPTTRERKLARAERLEGWADKREVRAAADYEQARRMASIIPFGQPILVGHHSERGDRNYRGRIDNTFRRSFESANMAENMRSRAAGIVAQADDAIYSDDPDAVEQLEAKIARLEAERAAINAYNKAARKGVVTAELVDALAPKWRDRYAENGERIAAYATANLSGNISRLRARLANLKRG